MSSFLSSGAGVSVVSVLLFICFAAWATQLAGVAILQKNCSKELDVSLNNLDTVVYNINQLATATLSLPQGATLGQLPASSLQQLLGGILEVLDQLTFRSSTSVFTMTPDRNCSSLYRYQWWNTCLQFFTIVLVLIALVSGSLHRMRVALCSFLILASMLDIENPHMFFNTRTYAPTNTLKGGQVFSAGCVVCAAFNLLMVLVLGSQNEVDAAYREPGSKAISENTEAAAV